jgi:hypothetical protein
VTNDTVLIAIRRQSVYLIDGPRKRRFERQRLRFQNSRLLVRS